MKIRKKRKSTKVREKSRGRPRILPMILLCTFVYMAFRILSNSLPIFPSKKNLIVLDPGHGGEDSGAVGYGGSLEKDINLSISRKLYKSLKSKDYNVLLTRSKDEYIKNTVRSQLANKKKARIFLSIHNNSLDNNEKVKGIQVLYYPNKKASQGDPSNREFAQLMMDSLVKGTGGQSKGIIERSDLLVLNKTKMPALLIECGFLSNKKEEQLLLTDEYQNKLVDAIVEGIESYFNHSRQENK